MNDLKQQIKDYFQQDYIRFYKRFCSDLQKSGREFKTLCHFHDDKAPSLSISPATGQFKCFGCGTHGDIFTFYAKKHGLSDFPDILAGIASDFGIPVNGARPTKEQPLKLNKRYTYTDADGNPLFFKNRYEPKTFRISRPNGSGGYISGLGDVQPVLFKRPEVLVSDLVFVVEGEKDADRLNELALTATTNFDGAGKWRDSYTQDLRGKVIVIIPDDDEPGRAHAELVAKSLHGVADSVKVLRLPNPEGVKGFDVSDWLTGQPSQEEAANQLLTMAEGAAEWTPGEDKKGLRLAVLDSESFLTKEMPTKTVLLDPWLMALSIILITGSRGVGKSWFLLSLLLAIVRKFQFGPWAASNSVPCLFLDGEMAATDMQERLRVLDPTGYRQSPLYIYSDAFASSQGLPRANLLDPAWRNDMKALLLDLGVKVWVVDNIASLTPGIDENSKQEWDPINQWLLELRFNEITTMLAHHTNRTGGQRGTSGREDNIDISILLKQPEGYQAEDGASFIASFTKARIAIPHLSKIADTAFRMEQDPDGKTVWNWNPVKQQRNQLIIEMHTEGMNNKEIAKELKCSVQNVFQVIKRHGKSLK